MNKAVASPFPDESIGICESCKAKLTIDVKYGIKDDAAEYGNQVTWPFKDILVEIEGPTNASARSDNQGRVVFDRLKHGNYKIKAKYDKKHPIIEKAKSHLGSTVWAMKGKRTPPGLDEYGNAHKCNVFTYEMIADSHPVAVWRRMGLKNQARNIFTSDEDDIPAGRLAPLAGHWATESDEVDLKKWESIDPNKTPPEPGDVVATELHATGWDFGLIMNASGHVGFLSYPEPLVVEVEHHINTNKRLTIRMQWLTIYAGKFKIMESEWPFRAVDKEKYQAPTILRHP